MKKTIRKPDKNRKSNSRRRGNVFRRLTNHRAAVFILAIAVVGGLFLIISSKAAMQYAPYPPHRAACVENSPSKTVVRPGERFTARVRIKNTGTSNFRADYGVYLSEYRDGGPIWNASGTNVIGENLPGSTLTFNLTVTAPSKPGTYSFSWAMTIVLAGFIRDACVGKTITVMNPPAVTILANGQNGNISLTRGSALTISWSASNSPSSCLASGSWGGGKPASGSENRTGDTGTSGTRTYTLTCSNAVGTGSAARTVTINDPPPAPSSPPAQPRPSAGTSSPSIASPQPAGSTPDNGDPRASYGLPSPQKPHTFSAMPMDDSTVRLTWYKEDSDRVTVSYELQRSPDNKNWQTVNANITDELYLDSDVKFETRYYYRLRSLAQDGASSDFVYTEVTTDPFISNTSDIDLTLESDDKLAAVIIPDGAIAEPALCGLRNDISVPPPKIKNHKLLTGPYQVLCKSEDGSIISSFQEAISVSSRVRKDSFIALKLFEYKDKWRETATLNDEGIKSYRLSGVNFAILGEQKPKPVLFWIALILGTIIAAGAAGFFLLSSLGRFKQQSYIKRRLADYKSKERGF